jgi:hypothetical protein
MITVSITLTHIISMYLLSAPARTKLFNYSLPRVYAMKKHITWITHKYYYNNNNKIVGRVTPGDPMVISGHVWPNRLQILHRREKKNRRELRERSAERRVLSHPFDGRSLEDRGSRWTESVSNDLLEKILRFICSTAHPAHKRPGRGDSILTVTTCACVSHTHS